MTRTQTLAKLTAAGGLAIAFVGLGGLGATATAETICASYPPFVPHTTVDYGSVEGPPLWNDTSSEIAAGSSLMCAAYPDPPNIWISYPVAPRR